MQKIKVFIADTHTLSREGIKSILSKKENIRLVGEAKNSKELRTEIKGKEIDILIIDYFNPGSFSLDDIVYLQKNCPAVSVLIISANESIQDVLSALDLQIKGYLLKECEEDEILRAIYAIYKKEKFFCTKVVDIILEKHLNKKEEDINPFPLSQREHEIVQLFSDGLTAKEIAQKLFLSHHTINTHRKNILKKLKVNSTTELVLYAVKFGIQ